MRDAHGAEVFTSAGDMSKEDNIVVAFEGAVDAFGPVDILVANAGIGKSAPFHRMELDFWQATIDLNLTGTFLCCKQVYPAMRERGYGRIVMVASVAGKEGNPNMAPYAVSKSGVIGFTKSLAKEHLHDGLRVNCVAPALIQTPLLDDVEQDQIDYLTSKIPMGRLGQPEEVAYVTLFLATDEASYSTGSEFVADGGWFAGMRRPGMPCS